MAPRAERAVRIYLEVARTWEGSPSSRALLGPSLKKQLGAYASQLSALCSQGFQAK